MASPWSALLGGSLNSDSTVILGAGAIGLSTAFELARHELMDNSQHKIFVVDPATAVGAGASGQGEGVLGGFGPKDKLSVLSDYSNGLHHDLAAAYNGTLAYGFSPLDVHAIFSHGYDPADPRLPFPVQRPEELSALPSWLNTTPRWQTGLIASREQATRLDASRYCEFLYQKCKEFGVEFLLGHEPTSVQTTDSPHHPQLSSINVTNVESGSPRQLPCRNLVLATGSWSGRVFSHLFPQAEHKVPMTDPQPAQDWLRIRTPGWKPSHERHGCHQVWLDTALEHDELHFSTYLGGDMYVASHFSFDRPLESTPQRVHIDPGSVDSMRAYSEQFLNWPDNCTFHLVSKSAAFLPQTQSDLPIITRLDWQILFPHKTKVDDQQQQSLMQATARTAGGVFMNIGHYLSGILLAPGSGRIMADLILGQKPAVDISDFSFPT